MLHHQIAARHHMPSHSGGVPGRPDALTDPLILADTAVADSDVPLFSVLRSIVGLPVDDPRWWPARLERRPRGFASWSEEAPSGGHRRGTPRPLIAFLGGDVGHAQEFAPPTVAILERALQELRARDSAG